MHRRKQGMLTRSGKIGWRVILCRMLMQDLNDNVDVKRFDSEDESDMFPEKHLLQSIKHLVLRRYDDEFLFEDKAKFVAFLILIPWAVDFVVHDFVLMPFLDRYVKTVPLAAVFLDVGKSQKLQMVKALNLEKARLRFEVEIGKAPPLSDDEVWLELKHRAIEMRDEWRLENQNAFANIWSDMGSRCFFSYISTKIGPMSYKIKEIVWNSSIKVEEAQNMLNIALLYTKM